MYGENVKNVKIFVDFKGFLSSVSPVYPFVASVAIYTRL